MTSFPQDDNWRSVIGAKDNSTGNAEPLLRDSTTGRLLVDTLPSNSIDNDPLIADALNRIQSVYGDTVSVKDKAKMLLKFGRNPDVGTGGATIWFTGQDNANETYVERNLINGVSSNNTSDTGIGYVVTIEGHTVGADQSVSSITQTGGTATLTTGSAHGYAVDQYVNIEGANEAGYNGIRKVLTVPTTTTFTYAVASGTTTPATGTITTNHLNKTFVSQTAQLNGQSEVTLSTALARATRIYIGEQNNAQEINGEVYVYESTGLTSGKPTDTTKIHITLPSSKEQSQKASTSISSTDYWIVTSIRGSVVEKTAANADVSLEVRQLGGVFREVEDITASNSSAGVFDFKPYLIIPANSDTRLIAIASTANTDISGSIQGFLAN